jgi:hypothetical protein
MTLKSSGVSMFMRLAWNISPPCTETTSTCMALASCIARSFANV